jgi:hypothetical protein
LFPQRSSRSRKSKGFPQLTGGFQTPALQPSALSDNLGARSLVPTDLLEQSLERLIRDLAAYLSLLSHPHQQILHRSRELWSRERYPRYCSLVSGSSFADPELRSSAPRTVPGRLPRIRTHAVLWPLARASPRSCSASSRLAGSLVPLRQRALRGMDRYLLGMPHWKDQRRDACPRGAESWTWRRGELGVSLRRSTEIVE